MAQKRGGRNNVGERERNGKQRDSEEKSADKEVRDRGRVLCKLLVTGLTGPRLLGGSVSVEFASMRW